MFPFPKPLTRLIILAIPEEYRSLNLIVFVEQQSISCSTSGNKDQRRHEEACHGSTHSPYFRSILLRSRGMDRGPYISRACYELSVDGNACCNMREVTATRCRPTNVSGNRS